MVINRQCLTVCTLGIAESWLGSKSSQHSRELDRKEEPADGQKAAVLKPSRVGRGLSLLAGPALIERWVQCSGTG